MFYSHEILTSREGGIATVWLVATLGSKANNKKVNRKSILEVDVRKTCDIIIQPEAPMALRLQGNLLYGVVRVHSRQHDYILSDAETTQANMRAFLKAVKTSELDPNARKARADQLMIQDDPAFLLDLALPGLDIDLSALNISASESSLNSSILSAHPQPSSLSSGYEPDVSMFGHAVPSSGGAEDGNLGGFQLPSGISGSVHDSVGVAHIPYDDVAFNIDPGFSFDDDGLMIEGPLSTESVTRVDNAGTRSDFTAGARVRQGLPAGLSAGRPESALMDIEGHIPDSNEEQLLPDAEAFPAMFLEAAAPTRHVHSPLDTTRGPESSSSASAPLQRKRRVRIPKQLPVDPRQELRNADLADWKENYVANMTAAVAFQAHRKAATNAKRNAEFWMMERGIGGIGAGMGAEKIRSPLNIFSGPTFLDMLRGSPANLGGKRRREDDNEYDTDSDARRVRRRDDSGEHFGRGDDGFLQGDDTAIVLASDGIEVGRHTEPPLEDPSMPWNISASSRQASLAHGRGFQSSISGFPASAGGPHGSLRDPQPSSLDRRGSRMTSASPLHGRGGSRYSSLEIPTYENDDTLQNRDGAISDSKALEDFELYGPGAGVATQTAAESQWIRSTLTREANNFLDFVKTEIEAREPSVQEDEDELVTEVQTSVLFEELLPPFRHSKPVGAQGFYHVLALATTGQLNVKQVNASDLEGFGPIHLEVPSTT